MQMSITKAGLALAAWALAGSLWAQPFPRDEAGFTDHVAAAMRQELGPTATVVVKGPLTLGIGDIQANLDRLYAFCLKSAEGCAKELPGYVKAVSDAARERNAPPDPKAVRLVLRTTQYVQQAGGAVPSASGSRALQPRPFAEGLVLLPVLDSPRTLRMLTDKDNAALGLDEEGSFKLGMANLRATLKPLADVAPPAGPGKIGQLLGDAFNPSRMALLDSWAPLAAAQGGTLIVAVPATDALLYIGEDSPTAIDALRALVQQALGRVPNPLTSRLYRWSASGWLPVP